MLRTRCSWSRKGATRHSTGFSPGFTVVEILVVIGVASLVFLIGIPSLLSQLNKTRLEAAANDVANLVRQTRLRAIRDNQQYTVQVVGTTVEGEIAIGGSDQPTFTMEFNNPPIAIYPGGGIADCQDKYDGSGETWGGTSIIYEPTGVAQTTGAICVWDGGENILQILLAFPAGQPEVRKYLKAGNALGTNGFYEKTSAVTAASTWVWY